MLNHSPNQTETQMDSPDEKLTIVIPAFNEASAIGAVLQDVRTVCADFLAEVIVVDDGSLDGTGEAAAAAGARVIRHRHNRGYGAALKTGILAAQTEFVLTMDSDGQHQASDVRRLWEARTDTDMVVGQRTSLIHSPIWRMPGKWLLTALANYLVKRRIPDLNSGLRLIRRPVMLHYLHICPNGFSFSTTSTMAFLTQGYEVIYIPIEVRKRVGRSTVSVSTGLQTIILVLRIAALFDPLRVFLPLSMVIAAVGIVWGIPYSLSGKGVSVGSMLAIVTAVLIFCLGLICDQISQLRLEKYR
jgi:glycosyltransferase involved in cell wall biosynthesis